MSGVAPTALPCALLAGVAATVSQRFHLGSSSHLPPAVEYGLFACMALALLVWGVWDVRKVSGFAGPLAAKLGIFVVALALMAFLMPMPWGWLGCLLMGCAYGVSSRKIPRSQADAE